MSELKATTAQEIVQNEKDCDYMDELFGGVKMPPTQVYLKSEADKVIVEKDKTIAELKADYREACGRLQTANLIKDEHKAKADKLLSCLKYLVMRDLIKDCPTKKVAKEIVKEYDNGLG